MKKATIFFQANELVRKRKFGEAAALYQKIIDSNGYMKSHAIFNRKRLEEKKLIEADKIFKEIAESDFFDHDFYLKNYSSHLDGVTDFIGHYINIGAAKNLNPSDKFNTLFYRQKYKDVDSSKLNPLYHFVKHGIAEGRLPKDDGVKHHDLHVSNDLDLIKNSKYFDSVWYVENYSKLEKIEFKDLALHYLDEGYAKGYDPGPDFSTLGYLGYYRDVLAAGVNPLIHYLRSGKKEGRKSKPDAKAAELGLARLTPAESGKPDTILNYDFPTELISEQKNKKLFVHVHLYHEDMFDQVLSYLKNITINYELGVSVRSQKYVSIFNEKFRSGLVNAANVVVKHVPNRGRDVAPWVVFFREEIQRSDLFMHFHTKKSVHNPNHADWFRFSMHNTLGSKGIFNQILNIFGNDSVGVVAPCYFWSLSNQPNYGKNRDVVEKLYRKIVDIDLPEECPDYPAGSFFWIRTEVIKPLIDINLTLDDFDEEKGQIDETLAHGVERLIGLLPLLSGRKLHKVAVDIAFDMVNYVYPGRDLNIENILQNIQPKGSEVKLHKKSKIAIFSCLSGGYEEVMPLIKNANGADIYLYSDDERTAVPDGVNLRFSPYVSHIPVMTARYVKTHPHIWFQDYDYVFWVDSNIYFMGDVYKYIDMLEASGADLGVIFHPARYSFLEEGVELAQTSKVNVDVLNSQILKYKNIKKVIKSRLIETNFWVCKPNSPSVVEMMSLWWRELNSYTHRDQISVNYAVETAGVKVVNLMPNGESARSHEEFLLFEHAFSERKKLISNINSFSEVNHEYP